MKKELQKRVLVVAKALSSIEKTAENTSEIDNLYNSLDNKLRQLIRITHDDEAEGLTEARKYLMDSWKTVLKTFRK